MIGLQLLDREHGRFDGGRRDGFEKGVGHGLLDGQTADREAVLSASVDDIFAGAVITRRRVPAAIMRHADAGRNDRRWPCPATMPSPLSPRLQTDAASAWCWSRAAPGWPGRSPNR